MKTNRVQAHLLAAVICAGGFHFTGHAPTPAPTQAGDVGRQAAVAAVTDISHCRGTEIARRNALIAEAEKLDLNSPDWGSQDLRAIKAAALLMLQQSDATCSGSAAGSAR